MIRSLLATSLLFASAAHAAPTDRLIVKYKNNMKPSAALERAGQTHGQVMKALHANANGAQVIKLSRAMEEKEVAALAREVMERDSNVEYAEPDRIMRRAATPNDAYYSYQWHYFEPTGGLRANTAWDKSTGSGINVAVIDTGYLPHADMAGQFLPGYDFITDPAIAVDGNGRDNDPRDPGDFVLAGGCGNGQPSQDDNSSWHGLHVAGTVAALSNNATGVAGVAYGAKVLPVRVLGRCGGYTSDIADAIVWASGGSVAGVPANPHKARVLNLSLGGSGTCDYTTQNAINSARSRGAVVVVAAGNSAINASGSSPANCQGVVTVAATGRTGGRASYSNYGTAVDVAAPGGDSGGSILSTWNNGRTTPGGDAYANMNGTSMATPHVAAAAALMLAKNPALTPDDVEARLKATARPFPLACSGCGAGIVDAAAAVDASVAIASMNETEPNDTLSVWNAVTVNGITVNGNLGSAADNDYFMVHVPAGRTLTATLLQGSGSNDFDLYGYSDSGSRVAMSQNGAGMGETVALTNLLAKTSPRYIRVLYKSGGTGAANGRYTLKLSW